MPDPVLMGSLLSDTYEQLQARYSIDSLTMPMGEWVCRNTTLRGKPFNFEGHEFQQAIADDMHPNLWCSKISQVGLTEIQIRKMLGFLERNQDTTGLLTFPNQPMRDKNAVTRVKPVVDNDPVFNRERDRGATRSAKLIQLGRSFLHITDCTEGSATSTPSDLLMSDEVDLSNQKMLALFSSRQQHSSWKIKQYFSTPTHVAFGVSAGFSATDQREYLYRCPACNHWQIPDFTRGFVHLPGLPDEIGCLSELEQHHRRVLDLANAYPCCERCRTRLDLFDPSLREWVPTYPDRLEARGYCVRPFCTNFLSIEYIVGELFNYKRNNFIRGWWNTVIGKAYTAGHERLSEADIEACLLSPLVRDIDPGQPIAVGIDQGLTCHVVLFDSPDPLVARPFSMTTVPADDLARHVDELCERYNVVAGGIDRHPQPTLANQVHAASKGTIWPVEYRGSKDINPVSDVTGETVTHFQCDRTACLDRVAERVRRRNLFMSGYGVQKQVVSTHLRNMVRDEKPDAPARWLKLSEDDHYFHALGIGITGMKIVSYVRGSEKQETRQVVSIAGLNTSPLNNIYGRNSIVVNGPLG